MSAVPVVTRHARAAAVTVVLADSRPHDWAPLSTVDDIEVVAAAGNGREAVRAVLRHRPDVLVLDPQLADGATTIRTVAQTAPKTAVLVVTAVDDDTAVRTAFRAGARGYLVKGERASVAPAILGIAAGEVILGRGIASRITRLLSSPVGVDTLTTREHEIAGLLRTGMTNAAIGRELYLAPKTVSNNLSSIYAKLRVAGRAEAIALLAAQ
ncbi:DNA-binding NarL/FixJ family response regulator [Kibdelosporangium banguiense]|uniref:DNA-binding NarL/FixJ family response regulator n=1 Tax=Kibdelosporangium banguiense TaxID=1365924 RepID=A0ABS4U0W5_9PSEU|nr:response regulator transcription factor [Kibdelosporangium banguiense]MBP2329874.1 DNA-binding NarL/FixJ family response regulator [Kibdelosporangium banguiense]